MTNYKGKHIIVVGTNKAGTTSLFNYLSHHEAIQTGDEKQLNYFLSENYKLVKKVEEKKSSYLDYFPNVDANSEFLLDVSPDYMYDPSCLKSIEKELDMSNTKIVFVLRNPITRLESWYNYGKQIEVIGKDILIEEFLEQQVEGLNRHMVFCAQRTGQYLEFIKPYYDAFKEDQIFVGFFEELRDEPTKFMKDLIDFLGLDFDPYQEYEFSVYNKSVELGKGFSNSVYKNLRSNVLAITEKVPFIKSIIMGPGRLVTKFYKSTFGSKPKELDINAANSDFLVKYYSKGVEDLEKLIQKKSPWKEFN